MTSMGKRASKKVVGEDSTLVSEDVPMSSACHLISLSLAVVLSITSLLLYHHISSCSYGCVRSVLWRWWSSWHQREENQGHGVSAEGESFGRMMHVVGLESVCA